MENDKKEPQVYTARELAEILFKDQHTKSSHRTIEQMCRNGQFKGAINLGKAGWRIPRKVLGN